MALLKRTVSYRLAASSMIEVLVAMIVFTVVFTIGVSVYMNVVRSGFSKSKLKANLLLNQVEIDSKLNKKFINESVQFGAITIDKEIENYKDNSQLILISLKAYNSNHELLAEQKELWSLENE